MTNVSSAKDGSGILKCAIGQVLSMITDKSFRIFSYKDDFNTLWDLHPEPVVLKNDLIVIIWDKLPSRKDDSRYNVINVDEYITPIDWAVSYSIHLDQLVNLPVNKEIQYFPDILIIDIQNHFKESAKAIQFYKLCSNLTPWIKVLNVIHEGQETWPGKLFSPKCPELLAAIKSDNYPIESAKYQIKILKSEWQSRILNSDEPADRHSISNIIGPLLLIKDFNGGVRVTALKKQMEWIGLLPKQLDDMDSRLSIGNPWINLKDKFKNELHLDHLYKFFDEPLSIALVDDHAINAGWLEFLTKAIVPSGTNNETVKFDDYYWTEIRDNDKTIINIYTFTDPFVYLNQMNSFHLDIIFLDIRLFPTDFKQEVKFFRKLLCELTKPEKDYIKYNFISQAEIDSINYFINYRESLITSDSELIDDRYSKGGYYHQLALSLFPRFIASRDHKLPIVIFSSTGKRSIIKHFTSINSIIIDFEKPGISPLASHDIIDQTRIKFINAFEKAFDMAVARRFLKSLCKSAKQNIKEPITDRNEYYEIYIDESGTPEQKRFCVGGLLICYKELKDADILHTNMRKEGLFFYGSKETRKEKRTAYKEERVSEYLAEIYMPFLDLCSKIKNIRVIPFVIQRTWQESPTKYDPADYTDPRSLDNLYISMVKLVLETLLYELIPSYKIEYLVSLHVATRKRVNKNWKKGDWEEIYRRWGIKAIQFGQKKICIRRIING